MGWIGEFPKELSEENDGRFFGKSINTTLD